MADKPLSVLFKLTPKEAVDYLQGREKLTSTFNWQDMWQEEHATQFTVSRLARLDLLQAIQDGILKNVQGDLSRRDWMKNTQTLLEQAGWWGKKEVIDPVTGEAVTTTFDPARLKLIFDTNTRMAYSAGLWQRIERNKKTHPYIRYITMHDEKVRLSHRAWDNVTLPVDHPFWDTHFPPNGWRCRCRAMSITQAEYDAGLSPLGESLNKAAPEVKTRDWVNKRTGVVEQVPIGIDPGFAYNPGKATARAANLAQVETQKLAKASPDLAAAYKSAIQLPNYDKAVVDERKLIDYALNPDHPVGGDKSRRFKAAMGFDISNADLLVQMIREQLPKNQAIVGLVDKHGQRYSVDMELTGPTGTAIVRTAWITEGEDETPRLISVYVKES